MELWREWFRCALTRLKRNAVAYHLAPQPKIRRRVRPRRYGEKVALRDLWHGRRQAFQTPASPVYSESGLLLRYYATDRLWRPVGQLVRVVLVDHPRRSGNQYLHHKLADYRRQVRRKLVAYPRYVQLGCIAQATLQYLALSYRVDVWTHFRSWLRIIKLAQPPSQAVVAQALPNTRPEFLLSNPVEHDSKKFILERSELNLESVQKGICWHESQANH